MFADVLTPTVILAGATAAVAILVAVQQEVECLQMKKHSS